MNYYCHHCDKQVGDSHKCKAQTLKILLNKWKDNKLTKSDKTQLISILDEMKTKKQKKNDIWGSIVIIGMIRKLEKKRV